MLRTASLFLCVFILSGLGCKKDHISNNSLTLQPDNNPNEFFLYRLTDGTDESTSAALEIDGAAWTVNSVPVTIRSIVKFDLSTIPQTAVIDSARLSLYSDPKPDNGNLIDPNSGPDNELLVLQVTEDWTPATTNWTTQPGATTVGEVVIPSTSEKILDLPNMDVTAMVANMVRNNANFGFLLRLKAEVAFNSRIFCSSRYSDASKHPKLMVFYHTGN